MEITESPILIYDNMCYWCTKSAKFVNSLTGKKCLIVGHYSNLGIEIKKKLFPKSYAGLEMSWFIIGGTAYGGRSGLYHLILYILFGKKNNHVNNEFDLKACDTECRNLKTFFKRSASIFLMHKKFNVSNV